MDKAASSKSKKKSRGKKSDSSASGDSGISGSARSPGHEDVPLYLEQIHEWMGIPGASPQSDHKIASYKTAYENWNLLTELCKNSYPEVKKHFGEIVSAAGKTLKKARNLLLGVNKGEARKKDMDPGLVLISAMECLTAVLIGVSSEFEKDGYDTTLYDSFASNWLCTFNDIITHILKFDAGIGCTMLDVLAAMGNDIYCQIPERDQKKLIVFLVCNGDDAELSSHIRAKIGRCLGKLVEFPSMRDDVTFFMDVFGIAVKGLVSGEGVVKISYAWVFGNLTDAMVNSYMSKNLEDESVGFIRVLLHTAIKCTEVPLRGRYSSCRATGNIFRWMKLDMLADEDHRTMVITLTAQMVQMVGNGMDYKLRWNAAHALGHAIENDIFFTVLPITVTGPSVKTLAKWAAQSQNYKERTQCVVSLMKANRRDMYASLYPYVWDRVCLSVSRLPVEDCDSVDKFKIEAVLLIFHLISFLRYEDLVLIEETVLKYSELLALLVCECVPEIPLDRLDETLTCKDNLKVLMARAKNTLREECVSGLITIMNPVCGTD